MPSRKTIFVALAGFAALCAIVAAADGEESGPELAQRMRDFFFKITPAEAEISPSADHPQVFGVATDWPIRGHMATITAFADGTASLYISSGYIVMGGYGAKVAAKRYVEQAARSLEQARKTDDHPKPPADEVRFYIRTFDSVYVIRESLTTLLNRRSKHDALFVAANQVMTELFDTADKAQAADQDKK